MNFVLNTKFFLFFLSFFSLLSFYGNAQAINKSNYQFLTIKEDSLAILGDKIVNEEEVNASILKGCIT